MAKLYQQASLSYTMERNNEQWNSREVARLLALVETERRYYQEMVANLPISVAVMNPQGSLVAANRAFRQLYEVGSSTDLRKRSIEQIFPSAELQARIQSVFESGIGSRPLVIERTVLTGATPQRLRISIQPIRDFDEDSGIQALIVIEDMADSKPVALAARPLVEAPALQHEMTEPIVTEETPLADALVEVPGVPSSDFLEPLPDGHGSERIFTPEVPVAPALPIEQPTVVVGPTFPDPLPCVIWMADPSERSFIAVSPSASAMLDIAPDEWLQTPNFFALRIHPGDRNMVMSFYDRALASPGMYSSEFRMRRTGAWYRETILVDEKNLTGVITDVTARRAMEEQILQSQRFEAVSHLSGRLAHDVNNPLMIVNGYAEDLAAAFGPNDPQSADMREIQLAGQRIGELTAHLNTFTRKHIPHLSPVDVNAELAKVVERMRVAAGEYLQAECTPIVEPLTAMGDAGQLEAVLLELSAALVEGGGETAYLVLSAKTHKSNELLRPHQPLAGGDFIQISILNQSHSEVMLDPHLFESLLPGKDRQDPGPALAKAYKTVQDWGGTILAVPENNQMLVYLKAAPAPAPAAPQDPPAVAREEPAAEPAPAPKIVEFVRKTSVLIVEDEPGIRALMRKILVREGFEVFEAGNGAEALEILKQTGPFNLLITDVVMPGMTGLELANEVKEMDPFCGILYMSGFTADTGVETGQFPPGSHFLQKPFTLGSLLRKANEVLASTPRRPAGK